MIDEIDVGPRLSTRPSAKQRSSEQPRMHHIDHKPIKTQEELDVENNIMCNETGFSWIIIGLAFIIILLMIAIIWLVLKYNELKSCVQPDVGKHIAPEYLTAQPQACNMQQQTQQLVDDDQPTLSKNYKNATMSEIQDVMQKLAKKETPAEPKKSEKKDDVCHIQESDEPDECSDDIKKMLDM